MRLRSHGLFRGTPPNNATIWIADVAEVDTGMNENPATALNAIGEAMDLIAGFLSFFCARTLKFLGDGIFASFDTLPMRSSFR